MIVTGGADNKINSLLDRGNMALEDRDWESASKFFEEVLNNDSKNAQAYVGKALAAEQAQTLHKFVLKILDWRAHTSGETLSLTPDREHELAILRQYTLPGYVDKEDLHKLYEFDLTYHSKVPDRVGSSKGQKITGITTNSSCGRSALPLGRPQRCWRRKRNSCSIHCPNGSSRQKLQQMPRKRRLQERYAEHLKQADQKAEELYQEGLRQLDEDYQRLAKIAESSYDLDELEEAAEALDALEKTVSTADSLPSAAAAAPSRNAKSRMRSAERQRELREAAKERAGENRKIGIVVAIVAVVVVAAVMVTTKVIIPNAKYNAAVKLMNEGKYEESAAAFEAMGDYKDAKDGIPEAYYAQAESLLSAGKSKEVYSGILGIR